MVCKEVWLINVKLKLVVGYMCLWCFRDKCVLKMFFDVNVMILVLVFIEL